MPGRASFPNLWFDEVVSFAIECAVQDEVDDHWQRLTDVGRPST